MSIPSHSVTARFLFFTKMVESLKFWLDNQDRDHGDGHGGRVQQKGGHAGQWGKPTAQKGTHPTKMCPNEIQNPEVLLDGVSQSSGNGKFPWKIASVLTRKESGW